MKNSAISWRGLLCLTGLLSVVSSAVLAAPDIAVAGGLRAIVNGETSPEVYACTNVVGIGVNSSRVMRLTIYNKGDAALILDPVVIGGAGAAKFSVTNAPDANIGAGSISGLEITYTPGGDDGTHNASVSIPSNDPDESPYTFAIRGSATILAPGAPVPDIGVYLQTPYKEKCSDKTGTCKVKGKAIVRNFSNVELPLGQWYLMRKNSDGLFEPSNDVLDGREFKKIKAWEGDVDKLRIRKIRYSAKEIAPSDASYILFVDELMQGHDPDYSNNYVSVSTAPPI